jgi:hypothetical protein
MQNSRGESRVADLVEKVARENLKTLKSNWNRGSYPPNWSCFGIWHQLRSVSVPSYPFYCCLK